MYVRILHSIFQDPIYVLENNIPIDAQHYLTNMLAKPLLRIFEPILGEAKAESTLLRGEHTRTRTVVTSKIGALSGFTRKKQTCLGCKVCLLSVECTRIHTILKNYRTSITASKWMS